MIADALQRKEKRVDPCLVTKRRHTAETSWTEKILEQENSGCSKEKNKKHEGHIFRDPSGLRRRGGESCPFVARLSPSTVGYASVSGQGTEPPANCVSSPEYLFDSTVESGSTREWFVFQVKKGD